MTRPLDELKAALALADKTTPGEWDVGDGKANGAALHIYCKEGWALASTKMQYTCIPAKQDHANAALIAAAVNLVRSPALLAELEEVERLREWNRILALLSEESDARAEAAEARLADAMGLLRDSATKIRAYQKEYGLAYVGGREASDLLKAIDAAMGVE